MDKERKIKCDCGSILGERETELDKIKTKAMVCSNCKFTTLTKDQAREYIKLKRLHEIVDKERKIIKIGNSIGIILPEKLKEFGIKLGKRVKISALNAKAIKMEF